MPCATSNLSIAASAPASSASRLGDASAVIVVLDLDQQIALFDLLKVVDRHPSDITFDLGAERCDVTADIGIICGLPHAVTDPCCPSG